MEETLRTVAELNHPPVPRQDLSESLADDQDQACSEPSRAEVHAAVQRLKNGKAPGLCGITAEMLKASGVHGTQWLTNVMKHVWNSGVITPDWRKGIILPIYKGSPA